MASQSFRIGVLSDTHLTDSPEARDYLEFLLEDVLAPVDMIIHAGDLVSPGLLDLFAGYPFHAVRGNMDAAAPGIPIKKVIQIGGFNIGLIHGWGSVAGIEDRVMAEFSFADLDCLVYGHSHVPSCRHRGGVLFFNPGSPTDRRRMSYHSVGLLEINEVISGSIIPLD